MRVTIIRDDGVVGVDGKFKPIDLSTLPSGVRAVQWDGTSGHVEYDNSANTTLNTISSFQTYIDMWNIPPQLPIVPTVIPSLVSMRQARLALFQSGYLPQVDSLISAMPGTDGDEARITWQFSSEVTRAHPLISAMAASLPLTSQQLDDLFTLAATL